jgi:predicted nucleic acid-binding protein
MTDSNKKEINISASNALIDSSVWIAYFFEGKFKDEIEEPATIFSSPISLFEIKAKLLKKNIPKNIIEKNIAFIKKKTISIEINEKLAEEAAEIAHKHRLHTADALIYASAALNRLQLITLDNDFRGLPNAAVKEQ